MREYVFLECTECSDRNYRTPVSTTGGVPKLERRGTADGSGSGRCTRFGGSRH